MGQSSQVNAPKRKGWLLTVREPPDASSVSPVRVPLAKPRICGTTRPSRFFDGPQGLGYRQKPLSGQAGSNPAPASKWLASQLPSCLPSSWNYQRNSVYPPGLVEETEDATR